MDLTGKKVLVVGLARTGVALTHFLTQAGARVTVTDVAQAHALAAMRAEIQNLPVVEEFGVPEPREVRRFDLILPSPGVPPELPWLEAARRRK
jgi:UDP-N-acetylmuramoylalanine--D-glutamate ligase